jgi:hypothetical protein
LLEADIDMAGNQVVYSAKCLKSFVDDRPDCDGGNIGGNSRSISSVGGARRRTLEAWATYLLRIVEPPTTVVVPLAVRGWSPQRLAIPEMRCA